MPEIVHGEKVLVTGANGYIAMWVVRQLLERGYSVRGTVRTAKKAKFLVSYFADLGYSDKFTTVVVDDITKNGAFDEAVQGIDAIAHTASPFHPNARHPDDLVVPAVNGTLSILNSALKHGEKIKRVVVTSSCAAIITAGLPEPHTFNEADWNELCPKLIAELGEKANAMTIYRASKTLAERAAWDFVQEHKNEISWDLSVINPPFVFGPAIHEITSLKDLNLSLQMWTNIVLATEPKSAAELLTSTEWVDVRDVALGHVLALEKTKAAGERIIVAAGNFNWQEWLDVAASLPNNIFPGHSIYRGDPSLNNGSQKYIISYDHSKQERILGIKYHTKAETTKDTLEDFARRGW